jgi:UDP-glucuronate 4-epimerase
MNILVTGAAGFIGFHATMRLLQQGHRIVGVDNLNSYYSVALKERRLEMLRASPSFEFNRLDLAERDVLVPLLRDGSIDVVLHLGAQAGVRNSILDPYAYIDSNIMGTLNVLEACRAVPVKQLVYASSSSVYGANVNLPFSTGDRTDSPVSLYAATKKANELMCYSYAHLYGIPATGLRFFTVYGPWGRPDMAYFKFAEAILKGSTIEIYNHGDMRRDFTYIDDVIDGIEAIVTQGPRHAPDGVAHKVYNIGHSHPESLLDFVQTLEKHLGREARKVFLPMQPGDVYSTYADIDDMKKDFGYATRIDLDTGLKTFAEWYLAHHGAL